MIARRRPGWSTERRPIRQDYDGLRAATVGLPGVVGPAGEGRLRGESGGEVAQLHRCVRAGETCACRVPIREYSFLSAVCAEHPAGSIDDARRMASFQRVGRTI